MHNGSIGSLEGVLDYYRLNVKDSPTLDPLLKNNGRPGIDINNNDKEKIILFLHTLTDSSFVRNPLYSQ